MSKRYITEEYSLTRQEMRERKKEEIFCAWQAFKQAVKDLYGSLRLPTKPVTGRRVVVIPQGDPRWHSAQTSFDPVDYVGEIVWHSMSCPPQSPVDNSYNCNQD